MTDLEHVNLKRASPEYKGVKLEELRKSPTELLDVVMNPKFTEFINKT